MLNTALKKIFNRKTEPKTGSLTILYGGHSGNSEFIAKESHKYLKKNGLKPRVVNMKKYNFSNLREEHFLLVVVSTHGEGEPPSEAKHFYRQLFASGAPALTHLRFAVCALGDSSYELFCQTGKEIDRRFEELGATRFYERADCDVEFQQTAAAWVSGVLRKYHSAGRNELAPLNIQEKKNTETFRAILKSRYILNEGSDDKVYHLALSVDDGHFKYQPGDSVSILPQNPDDLVNALLAKINGKANTQVEYRDGKYPAAELLKAHLEITVLSKGLLERYRSLTGNGRLEKLLGNEKELQQYLKNHDVLDLLTDFPCTVKPGKLVDVFRPIQPRLYSVASSLKSNPGEVHLTVKLVRFKENGRVRHGACSSYLNCWTEPGRTLNLQVMPNNEFRLPENDEPVIMIAAGTGIAPFRAFLQELEAKKCTNPAWLIFGEKHREHDFFYGDEWQNWLDKKVLTRMDFAFSRDSQEKVYVQHKIEKQAALFYEWLQNGAHVYICGSVKMAHNVRQSVIETIKQAGQISHGKAAAFVDEMEDKSRWHEDSY